MGNCCGGEDGKSNLNVIPSNRPGKGAAQVGNNAPESTSDNIYDFTNDKVREIINRLGDYKQGGPTDSESDEERPISNLENNAKYKGQWSTKS